MELLTIFLVILIVALLIGNFFLSVTEPKEKQAFAGSETQKLLMPSDTLSPGDVYLIHEKLDRIEKSISERSPSAAELQQDELIKKLEALVNFRREMTIEVEALKDQVKEIKGSAGLQDKAQREIEIDNQKLHDLIYNNRK